MVYHIDMPKPYKTKEELITHLVADRNVTIVDDRLDVFDFVRYSNLVDAFKEIIAINKSRGNYQYSISTSIDDFVSLHQLDEFISLKLISYIDGYEKQLKLFISNIVCESMVRAGSDDCCDYSLFAQSDEEIDSKLDCFISFHYMHSSDEKNRLVIADDKTKNNRTKVIEKIVKLSSGQSNAELNYYSKDYISLKRCLPFYILISNLSFSNLIIIFEMFKESIQNSFMTSVLKMNVIHFNDIKSLSTKHNIIRIIRNATHHHEPIIPFLVKKDYLDFTSRLSSIQLIKTVHESNPYKGNISVKSDIDISPLDNYTSKQSKKLKQIVKLVKEEK